MRKLLLTTTALATVASFSALADVTVGGYYEWSHSVLSSKIASEAGSSTASDSEVNFTFTNKTDSGIAVKFVAEFDADAGAAGTPDESRVEISGGFGTVILGENEGIADMMMMTAEDLMGEEVSPAMTSATIGLNSDVALDGNDTNKVTYKLPAMGGLTVGVSYLNAGISGDTDTTSFGGQYTMPLSGGAQLTFGATSSTQATAAAGTIDNTDQGMSAKIVNGPLTVTLSKADKETANDELASKAVGVQYKYSDTILLSAYTMTSEDALDTGEEYKNSGVEIKYTVASGLNAIVTHNNYKFEAPVASAAGVTGSADNEGSNTKLTIQAGF